MLRGSSSYAAGVAQVTAALSPAVNVNHAIAFSGVQAIGGQSDGAAAYTAADVLGEAQATLALSGTALTLDRGSSLATADFGWFVVQFKARRILITP